MAEQSHNFKVNLAGIIDILSQHLYSEPKVFVRELLQNATDAIRARSNQDPQFVPRLNVELIPGTAEAPPQIVFEDNGIGLTEEEIHQFVASIGASSKKRTSQISADRNDFIGQFGIGLLSCFMVTDEIVMTTQSAAGGPALAWYGKSDGSYQIKKIKQGLSIGTRVYLKQKTGTESLFREERLRQLLHYYGALLPFPIHLNDEQDIINPEQKILFASSATEAQLLAYGEEQFGTSFLAALRLEAPDGRTHGIAFILPYAPNPTQKTLHKVYLRRMLISETVDNILPDWAFFVKCIINTDSLRPTASRESFYEDNVLQETRSALGLLLKKFLIRLAQEDTGRLNDFLRIHHLAVKMLALHDQDFFELIIPFLNFDTSLGFLKLREITDAQKELLYTNDYNEFQQLSSIASAQNLAVINTAYAFDHQLIMQYGQEYHIECKQVDTDYFINQFAHLELAEKELASPFLAIAAKVLASFNCEPVLRKFQPDNVPTIYYMDKQVNMLRSIKRSQEKTTNTWAGILENIIESSPASIQSKICFNYHHPLLQQLIKNTNSAELAIQILYVQALMLGRHSLNKKELNILSEGMIQLMIKP